MIKKTETYQRSALDSYQVEYEVLPLQEGKALLLPRPCEIDHSLRILHQTKACLSRTLEKVDKSMLRSKERFQGLGPSALQIDYMLRQRRRDQRTNPPNLHEAESGYRPTSVVE